MLFAEFAPLALERMLVGCIMVFVSSGLVGLIVTRLQRSYRINTKWALIMWIIGLLIVVSLQGIFQIAERLAPIAQPYTWVFGLIGFAVTLVFWTLCLYTLFGGKASDLEKLVKRR